MTIGYNARAPFSHERISRALDVPNRGLEITTPLCIFKFRYSLPLYGFVKEVFEYYNLCVSQLHLNG